MLSLLVAYVDCFDWYAYVALAAAVEHHNSSSTIGSSSVFPFLFLYVLCL